MRRYLLIVLFASITLSLIACNDSGISNNTIYEAKLTDVEKSILSATTDKSFVFNFNVDSIYKELSIWIEKYEAGELVDDQQGHLNSDITNSGQIIFSTLDSHGPENESIFNISIVDENGSGRLSYMETIPEDHSSTWGSNQAENIPITAKVVLASMVYSNESHMSSLSADFYSDPENHMDEIKDYDVVYLLKGEFIK